MWAALAVDRRGAGLALVTGSEREVLLAIRTRWPGLPIQRLAHAIVTETTDGRRVNPAGVPVLAEIAHAGGGRWLGLMLAEDGQIVEAIWTDSKAELLALLRERWPRLPVKEVPHVRENPAGIPRRVEVTYSGRGEYSAFVLDEQGHEVARVQADSLEEIRELLREHYPSLPLRITPLRNPAAPAWRKEGAVTDRGLRYRATAHPPPGPRICALCGAAHNIIVGHLDGHEENCSPSNLLWSCYSCNTLSANTLRLAGIGRATHQRNPPEGATTLAGWLSAVMAMRGASDAMPVAQAVAVIRATDPETRSQFAHQIWRLRRARYGPTGRSDATPF